MSLSLGIIGLPNVGKSTIFQALTKKKVDASNYPFCTIDPNVGVVAVPDHRLDKLATLSKSEKTLPTTIEFVDIAGLVKGAAQGEGLGNKFLHNIREVDALVQIIRVFDDPNIIHVHGTIDADNDKAVINLELVLADLETATTRLNKLNDQLKGPADKQIIAEQELFSKIIAHLEKEQLLTTLELSESEKMLIRQYTFLTRKPILYVYNVGEKDLKKYTDLPGDTIAICGKLESELADIPSDELPKYIDELGISDTGLNQLISKSYALLNLITFITTGPEETKAWTVTKGTKAPQAAGVIHTDFEKGFIRAETIGWQELLDAESWTEARNLGTIRTEGKEYIIQDGDTVHFHFNP